MTSSRLLVFLCLLAVSFRKSEGQQLIQLDSRCFDCICEGAGEGRCDNNRGCVTDPLEQEICGPFQLSQTYFFLAEASSVVSEDFRSCTRQRSCSERVIQLFVSRQNDDCNGDGVTDCSDLGLIHFNGGRCPNSNQISQDPKISAFNRCIRGGSQNPPNPTPPTRRPTTRPPRTRVPPLNSRTQEKCEKCLCKAQSNCKLDIGCTSSAVGSLCGPFQISEGYWVDGGRQGSDFQSCARDFDCSVRTIRNYVNRFGQQCVKTTNSPCELMYRLHLSGPTGCKRNDIPNPTVFQKLQKCFDN